MLDSIFHGLRGNSYWKAFSDESYPDGIFVSAGYIAGLGEWAHLWQKWQALLDLDEKPYQPISTFKMRNLSKSVRGLRRAEMFYRLIEEHVAGMFAVVIYEDELKEAVSEYRWPDWVTNLHHAGNANFFAFRLVIEGMAHFQEQWGIAEPVDFVFDDHSGSANCLRAWEHLKATCEPKMRKYLRDAPRFEVDEAVLPLQSADLLAYWVRRWVDKGREGPPDQAELFPWKVRRHIPGFIWTMRKADFEEEIRHAHRVHVLRRAGVGNAADILRRPNRMLAAS